MRSRSTRDPRRSRGDPSVVAAKPNLTPMIDITFQLVVFLLVAQDLAPTDPTAVELPQALHAAHTEDADPGGRITVTLVHDGPASPPRLMVRGVAYSAEKFDRLLQVATATRPRDPEGISPVVLHLRSDARVAWEHSQRILQSCAREGVRLRHVQFATRNDDPSALASADAAPRRTR